MRLFQEATGNAIREKRFPGPEQRISEPEEIVAVRSYNFSKQLQKQRFSAFPGSVERSTATASTPRESRFENLTDIAQAAGITRQALNKSLVKLSR